MLNLIPGSWQTDLMILAGVAGIVLLWIGTRPRRYRPRRPFWRRARYLEQHPSYFQR